MQGCALFLCGASRFGEKTYLKRGVFLSMALAGAGAETEWRRICRAQTALRRTGALKGRMSLLNFLKTICYF